MGSKSKKRGKGTENASAPEIGNPDFLALEGGAGKDISVSRGSEDRATVLYIGRIPHGFYESEMEEFFQQFGKIRRLRIVRNRKTGKSRHFGFIEFESPEVARVVEECMHNYLIYESLLQVRRVPPERNHPKLWKHANILKERFFDPVNSERKRQNKERTLQEQQKVVEGIIKRDQKRRRRIKAAGIDYECPEFVGSVTTAAKKIKFDED